MAVSLTIDPRFNGPPDSGHGGYTCGLLGVQFDTTMAVSLRVPPPIGEEMGLYLEADRARLMRDHGEPHELVADARPAQVDVDPPPMPAAAPPAPDDPVYGELHEHPFPTCFGCGPDRAAGDGLRIFVARVPGDDGLVAAGWTPDANLARRRGRRAGEVYPVFVWAALDCPTGHACAIETPAVLARLAVKQLAPVRAGEPYVVAAWPTWRDGRKHGAQGCLYAADGTAVAVSEALWIELRT